MEIIQNNKTVEEVFHHEYKSDFEYHQPMKTRFYLEPKDCPPLEEVIKQHALPFLPAKSLCRFRAVSKEWNRWISSPFLAHMQTTHFKDISGLLCQSPYSDPSFISFNRDAYSIPSPSLEFLPERVCIRAACNGLVCCQSRNDEFVYYMCNPVTEDWEVLPEPNLCHTPETAIALAFDPTALNFSANYWIVCAVPVTLNGFSVLFFEIYSKSSNSWRVADTICGEPIALNLSRNGFYMKNVVYWKTLTGPVLAFDLKNELYGILPLLSSIESHGAMMQMYGELCYILPQIQDGKCMLNVYGNMAMSLKCVIPLKSEVVGETVSNCRVLTCVNDDMLIILLPRRVIAYHVREQKVELLSEERTEDFETFLPYINSLVTVHR
ncbi:F-box protein At5g49610-like [Pistacia vera]|uniref:F-box protein At5g49610-like n=1 Tax=Pistacia vera TaxID=55513 RepID=UPI001263AAA6|nr:F-box protein At5g49610-like [Pistacia vera]